MTLETVIPTLWVGSVGQVEEAVCFYKEKLGFDIEFALNGDDGELLHASVANGGVRLMVGYKEGGCGPLGSAAELYIMTDAVDAYYARVRDAGTAITREITDEWWGDRLFTVTDPGGYVLTFAQTVREFHSARVPSTVA